MTISVLIADPQRLFAEALATALAGYDALAVCRARPRSPDHLLSVVEASKPHVVLADSQLVAAEGRLAALRACAPQPKVVALSWLHQADDVEQLLLAGAVGYLPKDCDVDVVVEAIRQAHAGEWPVLCDRLQRLVRGREQRHAAAQQIAQRVAALSSRELEVLGWLAAGNTTREIAEQLGTTPATIQTHIRNLKRKTGARTQLEAVRMASGIPAVSPT